MSTVDLRLPDLGRQWTRIVTEAIRDAVERRIREEVPASRQCEVAATERPGYTEVMIFVSDLDADAELRSRIEGIANEIASEISEKGYQTAIYVQSFAPRVRGAS